MHNCHLQDTYTGYDYTTQRVKVNLTFTCGLTFSGFSFTKPEARSHAENAHDKFHETWNFNSDGS